MPPRQEPIGGRAARGVLWALAGTGGARLVSLVSMMVLARILAPEDFGLLAFALVVLAWAETVGDLGTGMALVRWPRRRDDAAQLTFLVNLGMGVAWFAALWLAAPSISQFLGQPEGTPVLRALAWAFPMKLAGATHEALARKDLRFRGLLLPELGMALFKASVAVVLALRGWEVWSLVAGHLGGVLVWSVACWAIVDWRPGLRLPRGLLGPMLRFGRGLVAVNLIAAVVHHIDYVIVGRMAGVAALGFYQLAARVPDMTIHLLLRTVSRVVFPAYAAWHAREDGLREPFLATLRYVSILTLPASCGLALMARPLVEVLFGAGWEPSVPILRAIAVYGALRSLGTHAGDVLKATGRSGLLAALALIKAAVVVPALVLAGPHGATAVAWSLAGATFLTLLLNLGIMVWILELAPARILAAMGPGAACTALMGAAVAAFVFWQEPRGAIGLALGAGLGVVVYAGGLAWLAPDVYRLARRLARGERGSGGDGRARGDRLEATP